MNIFEVIMLDVVLILFPLIIYDLFLSTNKNINSSLKKYFFGFCLLSAWYLTYRYSTQNTIVNLFVINSLIIIGVLKKQYYIATVIELLTILSYMINYNYLVFMIIPYLVLLLVNSLRTRINISDFIFIDFFLIVYYISFIIWMIIFNFGVYNSFGLVNFIILMVINYIIIHIIYYLYLEGESIVKYHLEYKELYQEKQIRLSLFKITHEIKNPIAVIKAYLDMLNVNNNKQVRKYIPIIKGEIDRLLALLQDFMLVNKENVHKDIMDINMLIEDVTDSMSLLLKQNDVKLITNIIDDEILIDGDYKRLNQVLVNIIKNSIEAMDKDKKEIKINEIINNNELNIIIEDNGQGINESEFSKLKTPFYTTKLKGTGLGVSLSDEIIKAHDGVLKYKSKEGKGTSVTISLPLNKERMG